jgi:hypothetical protein
MASHQEVVSAIRDELIQPYCPEHRTYWWMAETYGEAVTRMLYLEASKIAELRAAAPGTQWRNKLPLEHSTIEGQFFKFCRTVAHLPDIGNPLSVGIDGYRTDSDAYMAAKHQFLSYQTGRDDGNREKRRLLMFFEHRFTVRNVMALDIDESPTPLSRWTIALMNINNYQ